MSFYSFSKLKAIQMAEKHAEEVKTWTGFQRSEMVWAMGMALISLASSLLEWYFIQTLSIIFTFLWLREMHKSAEHLKSTKLWLTLREHWLNCAEMNKFNE